MTSNSFLAAALSSFIIFAGCAPPTEPQDSDGDGVTDPFDCNPDSAADAGDYRDCDCPNHASTPADCFEDDDDAGPDDDDDAGPVDLVLSPDTIDLDSFDDLELIVVGEEDVRLEFTGDPASKGIEAGKIILATGNGGVLRRVDAAAVEDGALLLQTSPASMTEAFEELRTSIHLQLEDEERGLVDFAGEILRDTELTPSVQVDFGGFFDSSFELDLDFDLSLSGVRSFEAVATTGFDFELLATVTFSETVSWTGDRRIWVSQSQAFASGGLAGIWWIEAYIGVEAAASAGVAVSTGVMASGELEAGLIYEQSAGWSTEWTPTYDWQWVQPEWSFPMGAEVRVFVRPEVHIRLYGAAGPRLMPRAYLLGTLDLNPPPPAWTLKAGFDGSIAADVSIFDFEFEDVSLPLFDVQATLAQGTLDPGGDDDDTPGDDDDTPGDDDDTPGDDDDTPGDDDDTPEPCTDGDGDGYGSPASASCAHTALDCDDALAAVHPGATEICDGTDQDCIPGNEPFSTWYRDEDGDGYGTADSAQACSPGAPYTATNSNDCNDADDLAWSGALEQCGDGSDNDCIGGDDTCPWIDVTGPTGTLTQDQPYTVLWASGGFSSNVRVHAYKAAAFYYALAADTADDGSLPFTPPAAWPTGSDWQICISDLNNLTDDCGEPFSIAFAAPVISITSPSDPYFTTNSTLTVEGIRSDANTVTWSASSGPSGVCSVGSGTFSCLVTNLATGSQIVTVTGTGPGGSATDTVTIDVQPAPTVLYSQDFSGSGIFSEAVEGGQTFSDLTEWWDAGLSSYLRSSSGQSGNGLSIYNPGLSGSASALQLIIPAAAASSQDVTVTFQALSYGLTPVPVTITRAGSPSQTVNVDDSTWQEVSVTLSGTMTTTTVHIQLGLIPQSFGGVSFKIDEIVVTTP